ncbi:MAG: YlxR family protein [Caldisericia bacterium]
MKKILRRCIYCKKVDDKKEFLRIVRLKNNDILVDNEYKYFGRSVYICKNINCINGAFSKKKIEKGLRVSNVSQDLKEKLKNRLIESIEEVINEEI